MTDEDKERLEEPLILMDVVEPEPGRPGSSGGMRQALWAVWHEFVQKLAGLGPVPRALGIAGVGLVAVVLVGVGLSQGLTAAFNTSWPARVAGVSDPAATPAGVGVERTMPAPSGNQKLAGVHDLSEIADRSGGIGISPDGASRGDYLPPSERGDDIASPGTVITVPVGHGRLLRFDEAVESVFIADPGIADIRVVSPELVYVYGKKLGNTNMMAISGRAKDAGQTGVRLTGAALLRVILDPRPPSEAKQQLAPEAPAYVSMFGTRAVVNGQIQTVDQAVDLANIAQTYSQENRPPINSAEIQGSNQVNIRVRFAEVQRNDLRSFGIDWSLKPNSGSFTFGVEKNTIGRKLDPNIVAEGSIGNFNIELLIEALQANGALTVLAEPNLTAVTGETASFLAGGEVPIPVPSGENGSAVTVQYKPFGVSLSFTPTVIKEGRIGLKVKPEVSSISAITNFGVQGFSLPSFTVRRAETVVEVASGQTFALAGLFQRDVSRSVEKLPVLGDVPILGQLFRSERYQRNETELVILITPYLVEPVSDRRMATPLDRSDLSASWQANIVTPDGTDKGAGLTNNGSENSSGFILK